MKKILLIMATAIIMHCSCDKIELSGKLPNIQLKISSGYVYSDTIINAGKQYTIGIIASAATGENLTNLIIQSNGTRIIDKGFNAPEFVEDFILTKSLDEIEKLDFIILNKARKADTLSISVQKLQAEYSEIIRYNNIQLGAQSNLSKGNYLSFSNGQIFNQAEAFNNQDLIDLIYFYDVSGDANTIGSPAANLAGIITGTDAPENWAIKRTTLYSREALIIDNNEFNLAINDSLILSNIFTNGGKKAKQLQNGQYFGFQNNESKFGIIKIESVSGQEEGEIQLSLIIQK